MKHLKTIKTALILGMMVLANTNTMAQTETPAPPAQREEIRMEAPYPDEGEIFVVVEQMPEFPGGADSMEKFIAANLVYPAKAKEMNLQGAVLVEFIVDTSGRVSNVRVIKGIGSGCDQEARRVVRMMPKWSPGKQKGEPVRVAYKLIIRFQLETPQEKR